MKEPQSDVRVFMQIAGQPIGDQKHPHIPFITWDEKLRLETVRELLKEAGAKLRQARKDPDDQLVALRARLVVDETEELIDALAHDNVAGAADAVADLCYVALGLAITFGIDMEPVWEAVQEANMRKFPDGQALFDDQGKVIKPPGWKPADIEAVLARQSEPKYTEPPEPMGLPSETRETITRNPDGTRTRTRDGDE